MQPTRSSPRSLAAAVVRAVRWHRRTLAALLAALATLTAVAAARPDGAPTRPVVVAARDLPGGVRLTAADLRVIHLPGDVVPAGALGAADALVGQAINGPLSRLSPVTRTTVATGQNLARPGYVVTTLDVADPSLRALLVPGRLIDVLGADGRAAASAVRVVGLPAETDPGLLDVGDDATPVLLEVTTAQAAALAAASHAGRPTVVVR